MDYLRALTLIAIVDRDLSDVLRDIAQVGNDAIPGADSTSITLIRDDEPFTAAHIGQMSLDADELQYERGYGPCMDAGRSGLVLIVDDMREETRWPDYAPAAASHGVLSSMSVPLPYQGTDIGALNVYSPSAKSFGPDSVGVGREVAAYIAAAVANADGHNRAVDRARQMEEAMRSRAVIEMAKGMLIARHGCTPDEAFTMLNHASQRANRKLRDIAQQMVEGAAGQP